MTNPEAELGAIACAPGTKSHDQTVGDEAAAKVSRRRKPIKIDELPPPGITRWVIHRKAQVVAAVQAGALSLEEVCERYSVSVEEFQSWQKTLQQHGVYGLRTTRSQIYRSGATKGNGKG
ncbi:CtrA inhibitor SciP [Dongia sp. agr-C8]